MVIAVASVAVVIDRERREVRVALGSVGPTCLRAREAEAWVGEAVDWKRDGVTDAVVTEFGRLVAAAAMPIDDHRSSAAYRRHAIRVCAQRALRRGLSDAA
jgi:CO/xanthine dehydrogenase FAD-binding subunit